VTRQAQNLEAHSLANTAGWIIVRRLGGVAGVMRGGPASIVGKRHSMTQVWRASFGMSVQRASILLGALPIDAGFVDARRHRPGLNDHGESHGRASRRAARHVPQHRSSHGAR
jgi:hypothetical protein